MGTIQHKNIEEADRHDPKSHAHTGTYPQISDIVKHEAPTPATDGTTVTFQTAGVFTSNSLEVYMDGILQIQGTDYNEVGAVGATGFKMIFAPDSDEVLRVFYLRAA